MGKLLLLLLLVVSCASFAIVNPTGKTHLVGDMVTCADGNKWLLCAPGNEPVAQGVIFSENFDAQADWHVATSNESCNQLGTCNTTIPTNWDHLRNTESWHPDESDPTKQPSQRISNEQYAGASGKSWIRTHESSGTNSSTFSDDTLMLKDLGEEFSEVYVSFKIKFDPTWQWNTQDNAKFKLFRVQHFDGPTGVANPWDFFSDGDNSPTMILDIKHSNTYGMRWAWARRCDPQESVYYCDGQSDADSDPIFQCNSGMTCTGPSGSPTHAEAFGDNAWHTIKMRLKMNSAHGVKDGVFQLWFDGEQHVSKTDIEWLRTGSDINTGWNMFGIGGNTTNWYDDPANKSEQWYALDDIVISTEDIQ